MTAARTLATLIFAACLAAPALAQAPAKTPSVTARLAALEKENAALREDVTRLQSLLTQTRRDMLMIQGSRISGYVPPPPGTLLEPQGLAAQQAQANAAIQSQGVNQQLNNLQLQQGMTQDRLREQQLFQPQTFGATP